MAFPSPYLCVPVLFLVLGPGASEMSSISTVTTGTVGGSVTFQLRVLKVTEIDHVTWNGPQNNLVLVPSKGDPIFTDKRYQNRLSVNSQNYSLSIYNLTLKDKGTYKAQINLQTSDVTVEQKFTLRVYQRLQKPHITVQSVVMSDNTSCIVTLLCSVEGTGEDVQYSWSPAVTNNSESYGNSTVTLSWTPCDLDLSYTCKARNPVSKSSSSPIFIWNFCSDLTTSKGEPRGQLVVGILRESVTLPLALPTHQDIEGVVWMFNATILSKVQGAVVSSPLIKPQNVESSKDFSLKIDQLRMENAGTYQAFVCSKASGVAHSKRFTLLIYRRLKKPSITLKSIRPLKNSICSIDLACSVENSGPNVTYTWSPLQKDAVVSQGGTRLNISWRNGDTHPNLTCTASNPVSDSSQKFVPGDICPAPTEGRKFFIVFVLVFITLLCFSVTVWYIWKRKKGCGSAPAEEFPAATREPTVSLSRCRLSQGYDLLNVLPRIAGQQHQPHSDCDSINSNLTTEEDEDRDETHMFGLGRDQSLIQVSQGEPRREPNLAAPGCTAPLCEVNGDTVYTQVFFNSQGDTSFPRENESSATIYSSVQRIREVEPPMPQHGAEFPVYENHS